MNARAINHCYNNNKNHIYRVLSASREFPRGVKAAVKFSICKERLKPLKLISENLVLSRSCIAVKSAIELKEGVPSSDILKSSALWIASLIT